MKKLTATIALFLLVFNVFSQTVDLTFISAKKVESPYRFEDFNDCDDCGLTDKDIQTALWQDTTIEEKMQLLELKFQIINNKQKAIKGFKAVGGKLTNNFGKLIGFNSIINIGNEKHIPPKDTLIASYYIIYSEYVSWHNEILNAKNVIFIGYKYETMIYDNHYIFTQQDSIDCGYINIKYIMACKRTARLQKQKDSLLNICNQIIETKNNNKKFKYGVPDILETRTFTNILPIDTAKINFNFNLFELPKNNSFVEQLKIEMFNKKHSKIEKEYKDTTVYYWYINNKIKYEPVVDSIKYNSKIEYKYITKATFQFYKNIKKENVNLKITNSKTYINDELVENNIFHNKIPKGKYVYTEYEYIIKNENDSFHYATVLDITNQQTNESIKFRL